MEVVSTYNIFWRRDKRHFIITPLDCPERDRPWRRPRFKPKKGRGGELKEALFDIFKADLPPDVAANSYFVHKPCISFHHPPRTLRRGVTKNSPTLALINNSWFWRRWKLKFGELLADDRVVDGRGVISLPYGSGKTNADEVINGYKIRSWRLWGESGKQYHHDINAKRKRQDKESPSSDADHVPEPHTHSAQPSILAKDIIDEVVHFSWKSPFTNHVRDYHFQYCNADFYWKGTGTVQDGRTCGCCLRFNHLKLVIRVPSTYDTSNDGATKDEDEKCIKPVRRPFGSRIWQRSTPDFREICIAKYTSSVGRKKAGTLEIYDETIYRLVKDHVIPSDSSKLIELGSEIVSIKHTRLCDVIVATAMCMVIGEWQKREWVKKIIEAAAGEAGGNAG